MTTRTNDDFAARLKDLRERLKGRQMSIRLTPAHEEAVTAAGMLSGQGWHVVPTISIYPTASWRADCETLLKRLPEMDYFDAWGATAVLENLGCELLAKHNRPPRD